MKNWKDVYKLPLHRAKYGTWVYDSNSSFVFQFEREGAWNDILGILNGTLPTREEFKGCYHEAGFIKDINGNDLIEIRGWGNLTGISAMNLHATEAANIQDTFAEWIVETLNKI